MARTRVRQFPPAARRARLPRRRGLALGAAAAAALALVATPPAAATTRAASSSDPCADLPDVTVPGRSETTRQLCQRLTAPVTGATEHIESFDLRLRIRDDGSLRVEERIRYDFGHLSRHGIYRDIPMRFDYPPRHETDRVTPIDVVSVRASEGASAQYETSEFTENGIGHLRIRIGDPDRYITGAHTYTIVYRVRGALNGFPDHVELVWNVTGSGWAVPIDRVTALVETPGEVLQVNCSSGPYGSTLPCDQTSGSGTSAQFLHGGLGPHSGVTLAVAIPKGVVPRPVPVLEERWTFGRAFAVNWATLGAALVLLALLAGGIWRWLLRPGRDRRYRGSPVEQVFAPAGTPDEVVPLLERTETPVLFEPPDGLRPGEVGTLVDFTANPLDVTATIVDLAVRGHLTITEVEDAGRAGDWTLSRLTLPAPPGADRLADGEVAGSDRLAPYEAALLDALFRDGDTVQLSDLRLKFAGRMRTVQQALMDRAIEHRWFTHKPGTVRAITAVVGILLLVGGLALTIGLAATTHAGLVGLPVALAGLVVTAGTRWAPARTASGYAALRQVEGFRRFIDESEKERARFAEHRNLFSEYLPYAIVFGATERWARAFAALGAEAPDTSGWYRASRPFEIVAFSHAIDRFSVTTAGTLTAVPHSSGGGSGFSGGGGSSGGGFGGGGGGSW